MRIKISRIYSFILILIIGFTLWTIINYSSKDKFTETCNYSETFQDNLHKLAQSTSSVLDRLGVSYFLCYGSLWGQIRFSRTLPWERDIDFCVFNDEVFTRDEGSIGKAFRRNGLSISYDSSEGIYHVIDPRINEVTALLYVFEHYPQTQMAHRVGWKRRVLPPDCDSLKVLECFPSRLARPPLARREFGMHPFPVPNEGIEIQKYHFPDNWWLQVRKKNC